jgi:hypothetical protein
MFFCAPLVTKRKYKARALIVIFLKNFYTELKEL